MKSRPTLCDPLNCSTPVFPVLHYLPEFAQEQHCTGTWNVRYMNQGRLGEVKQVMTRVNIDILGIGELKWTGMGEFNSDDHYIYYCGQQSLRRNEVALIVNKRVQIAVLGYNLKNDRMISVSKANHSI